MSTLSRSIEEISTTKAQSKLQEMKQMMSEMDNANMLGGTDTELDAAEKKHNYPKTQ